MVNIWDILQIIITVTYYYIIIYYLLLLLVGITTHQFKIFIKFVFIFFKSNENN